MSRFRRWAGVLILMCGLVGGLTPPSADADPTSTPFGQPVWVGDAGQIITVHSAHPGTTQPGSTYATLTGWSWASGAWRKTLGPMTARVGSQGTTNYPSEYKAATPWGTYNLRQAFGLRYGPSGTRMPWRLIDSNSWWISDVNSRYYNTWQEGPPNGRWNPSAGERLNCCTAYEYAVAIDFNRNPVVKGKGSAIFLHVGIKYPTAGCVSVAESNMVAILRWLDPARRPRIAIE
jgi:L,D-peptidoglycan transpeptidase YkuD (ErfK/YbiS/YcfS/YnhG family)